MRRRDSSDNIVVEYREQKIRYDVERDLWTGGGFEDAKLSVVKKRIGSLDRKQRKPMVDALWIKPGYWDHDPSAVIRVTVTVLTDDGMAWVTHERNGRTERDKVNVRALSPLDVETEAVTWLSLDGAAKKAKREAEKFLEKIRRHDADSLMLAAKEKEIAS